MAHSSRVLPAKALLDAFKNVGTVQVTPAGYLGQVEDNLVIAVTREIFAADLEGAGGSELMPRDALPATTQSPTLTGRTRDGTARGSANYRSSGRIRGSTRG